MDRWGEYEAENHERDHKGERGGLRLWLPKFEYIDDSKNKYLDQRSHTESEAIKNPNQQDVEALTLHVHARSRALNFQNAFFHGGAGIPFLPQDAAAKKDKEDEASDQEQGDSFFIIVFRLPEWILSTMEPR